jgi:hypothetical protein
MLVFEYCMAALHSAPLQLGVRGVNSTGGRIRPQAIYSSDIDGWQLLIRLSMTATIPHCWLEDLCRNDKGNG